MESPGRTRHFNGYPSRRRGSNRDVDWTVHSRGAIALPFELTRKNSSILFHIKVARPGFWLTAAWFYLLPLGRMDVFHSWSFWLGLFYVMFPMTHLMGGWNDVLDREADRFNPRKDTFLFGARGTVRELSKLPRQIAIVQLPFLVIFTYLLGGRAILWFVLLIFDTMIYNWPTYGCKGRPPLEILNQAGYLLVFALSSWLNHAPQLTWPVMVFGAMFAMHAHVFGEVMDIEPDRRAGRVTTAARIGAVPSKLLIAAFLASESALIFHYFSDAIIAGVLALSCLWFLLDAAFLRKDRPYSTGEMRFALLAWNLVALLSMPWVWKTASLTRPLSAMVLR